MHKGSGGLRVSGVGIQIQFRVFNSQEKEGVCLRACICL